ncbi:hypothetical protein OSB04_027393 [Centaurea solstitialis]|uniref:Uncharacterized protein n=1 Tax=Centaurea solstitialis TaxID=347529 RepID=A0AA38VZN9_9ASTR|nr:hypothetical protein OSB04_027393 [Centaurea solstitialis]
MDSLLGVSKFDNLDSTIRKQSEKKSMVQVKTEERLNSQVPLLQMEFQLQTTKNVQTMQTHGCTLLEVSIENRYIYQIPCTIPKGPKLRENSEVNVYNVVIQHKINSKMSPSPPAIASHRRPPPPSPPPSATSAIASFSISIFPPTINHLLQNPNDKGGKDVAEKKD